ncbi:predicted protein [Naegleria gruberi]|uniref:Predicted protein n=1 Tax=Naegleria gruberi TaxID=5762 RepID=D2VNH7_NAEGR|nr:uncharacterized protein NAEGRDRAFT_70502 [Naegleria gruberi]EFC41664.1 predicted protein [Naegleria gruberi]|eukprot:XP_002674408.1 predicted protein [Naegleria gruberi strain NEG-M]
MNQLMNRNKRTEPSLLLMTEDSSSDHLTINESSPIKSLNSEPSSFSEGFYHTSLITTTSEETNQLNHQYSMLDNARDEGNNNNKDNYMSVIEEEIFPEESPTILGPTPLNNTNPQIVHLNTSLPKNGYPLYNLAPSLPRMSNVNSVNNQNSKQTEKNQLRMRAALNGHVIFSHHPKELGEFYHVEWWYYLSTFDHTMIPFFKHSQDGDTSIVQIGNAIHCRDYQLKLVSQCKDLSCDDLSHFWSTYYFDNQHRILTQSPVSISMSPLYHNAPSKSVQGGGHDNSMIVDEESLSEFDTISQDEIHSINYEQWIETKHNHEEPQMDDNFEQDEFFPSHNDEDYMADISNMSNSFHKNDTSHQDEIAHIADSRIQDTHPSHSAKEQDEDKQEAISTTSSRTDEEIMLSLDQFIESSSYHINEQFKIISREFSRIFF